MHDSRTTWQQAGKDDLKGLSRSAVVGEDGYANVAEQLGLSRDRGRFCSLYSYLLCRITRGGMRC